jgi:aldehyde dehydrogenase (NAD+)
MDVVALRSLGVEIASAGSLVARSPIDGSITAKLAPTSAGAISDAIARAHSAFLAWRWVPDPRRGELVRLLGEELRAH